MYRLVSEIRGAPYSGELRVRDYVKPTFYLDLIETSGALRAGEKFTYKLKAKRYAGGAPTAAKFEVFVYRKKYEVPQFVEEGGGGLSTGTDYFGGAQTAASLSQPQRVFSSIEERTPANERETMGEAWNTAATFDPDGVGTGEILIPNLPEGAASEWTYTIMFRAMDGSGSQAVFSKDFFQTLSPGVVAVRFSKAIAKPGEAGLRCNIRVTTPEGEPLEQVTGTAVLTLQTPQGSEQLLNVAFNTNKDGYASIPVPPTNKVGVVKVKAKASGKAGAAWGHAAEAEGSELLLIGENGEAVKQSSEVVLYTDSTVVSPGEHPMVYALLPDSWGSNASGVLWRTTAGEKVHGTSSAKITGRSYAFKSEAKEEYGTGYFETLTVPLPNGKFREATLGFRIIPWTKRLKVAVKPQQDVGEPMKPFVVKAVITHADGTPASGAEVALGIVDRAVYAVQPEFRPSIFDFFFPMPRLNLMTFYSDELQGYGYADTIKKPNFSLSALKSQAKLSKRTARDTAGWYPHLITNQYGEVSVTVPMPSNLTEWLVTATAIDTTGKVGEGTGGFRTAVDVEIEPRVPQFLRAGDQISVPMTVVNHLEEGISVSAKLTAEQSDQTLGQVAQESLAVKPKGSEQFNLSFTTRNGDAPVYLAASMFPVGGKEMKLGGEREFEVATSPLVQESIVSSVTKISTGGAVKIGVPLPKSAIPKSVKIVVSKGLLGLLLTNAESLVSYPYGCTEQLAHSTLPNIALVKIADGIPDAQVAFKDYGALVAKAKANTVIGVKRILSNQKPSGGFSLWPSDPVESPAITLMAMHVLQLASEIGVSEADRPLWKAAAWLESATKGRSWSPFELTQLTKASGNIDTQGQNVEFVTRTVSNPSAPFTDLIFATIISQRYDQWSWHSFNTKIKEALPGVQVTPHLLDRIRSILEKGLPPLMMLQGSFSTEDVGFLPSSLYLLSMILEVLPSDNAEYTAARDRVLTDVYDVVHGGFANSPFDRARLIEAVLPLVIEEAKQGVKSTNPISISIDGLPKPLMLESIPGGAVGTVAFKNGELSDLSQISIQGVPRDSLITARAVVEIPYEQLHSIRNGLTITRALHKVVGQGKVPLKDGEPLRVGDVVVSEVTVMREEHSGAVSSASPPVSPLRIESPSEWVAIRDGVPAISIAVDNDRTVLADAGVIQKPSGAQIANKELTGFYGQVKETLRYPERVERVVRLRGGEQFTSYIAWTVSFAGTAVVPPAEVFDMYAGGIRAASEPVTVYSK